MSFLLELKNMLPSVGSVGRKSVIIIIHFCRDLTIETGKLAKFADGAAVIKVMDS